MVCSEFQCTSALANSLHGMEDYASSVRGDICALSSSDDVLAPLAVCGSNRRLDVLDTLKLLACLVSRNRHEEASKLFLHER